MRHDGFPCASSILVSFFEKSNYVRGPLNCPHIFADWRWTLCMLLARLLYEGAPSREVAPVIDFGRERGMVLFESFIHPKS